MSAQQVKSDIGENSSKYATANDRFRKVSAAEANHRDPGHVSDSPAWRKHMARWAD